MRAVNHESGNLGMPDALFLARFRLDMSSVRLAIHQNPSLPDTPFLTLDFHRDWAFLTIPRSSETDVSPLDREDLPRQPPPLSKYPTGSRLSVT